MFNIGYNSPPPPPPPPPPQLPSLLPPINIPKAALTGKSEMTLPQIVKKLKEDRIIEVMNRQVAILEDLKYRMGERGEEETRKLKDMVEKLEKEREDALRRQRYEELIQENVDRKIKSYLTYGMGHNPYYPSQLPYLIFNLPKRLEPKKEKKKGKKKKKKVEIKDPSP